MADYRFKTLWRVGAPIEAVWDAINDSARWHEWWRGVERVGRVEAGNGDGVGNVERFAWRSRLPYVLRFDMRVTTVRPPVELRATAVGELTGEGHWRLYRSADGTLVRYDWNVRTTRWWMNLLAPVARPLFVWNHDAVMQWGGEGLERRLAGGG
jgi:Polyketide cyclase / dehydrase and lipid transport